VDVRRAAETDLAAVAAVRLSNGPAHDDSGANPDYCRYLIADGHLLVAEEEGRVVGFGGAVDIAGVRLLSDLYVRADAHGRGVGAALLQAVLAGASERMTFASNDPATIPLYTRAGMLCRWPLLTLDGSARRLPGSQVGARSADATEAAAVELSLTGIDRSADHRYWASRSGSHAVLLELEGAVVGSAAIRAAGEGCRIEHMAVQAGCELDAVAAMARWCGTDPVQAYVPGDRPLVAQLLAHGFRVTDTGMHMSTAAQAVHPLLAVLHPGLG